MRKHIAEAVALTGALGLGIAPEHDRSMELYIEQRNAAHRITDDCIELAGGISAFGISLGDIKLDIISAEDNPGVTLKEVEAANSKSEDPIDFDTFPQIEEFYIDKDIITDTYTIPNIQTEIQLTRFENSWGFSPENFDYVFRRTLETIDPDYKLRTVSYGCLYDEIYERNKLMGQMVYLNLVGEGEYANFRERIMPRGPSSRFVGNFNSSKQRIILTHWDPKEASRFTMHEFAHLIQASLGIPAETQRLREQFADTFDATAYRIMQEEDIWILFANHPDSGIDI